MADHGDVIVGVVAACGYQTYLELGIYDALNLARVAAVCPDCLGVDTRDVRRYHHIPFIQSTTDDFFERNVRTFDCIFIDANHNYEYVSKDLDNALKILNPGGTIFLHDTDPAAEELLVEGHCSDSFKIHNDLNRMNHVSYVTIPVNQAGLTLVRNKYDLRYKAFTDAA
jgi:predicted O-methyltransferase YrrM